METNPLRGLFRASSRRPVEQRVAPQPTEPTENVYFEILSGMVEKLLANPFAGDGTDSFLAPLPGSEAPLLSGTWYGNIYIVC